MHIAWHAAKVNIEATCYALWGLNGELAIIIIVCFDVWTIMDYHLLVASQWITYPNQVWILFFDAPCMARRQDAYWGNMLRTLGIKWGASNNQNNMFWRMNDHGLSLAGGFPMHHISQSSLDLILWCSLYGTKTRCILGQHVTHSWD